MLKINQKRLGEATHKKELELSDNSTTSDNLHKLQKNRTGEHSPQENGKEMRFSFNVRIKKELLIRAIQLSLRQLSKQKDRTVLLLYILSQLSAFFTFSTQ